MKKKILTFLFVLASVIACTVCLVACNSGKESTPAEYVGKYEFVSIKNATIFNGEPEEEYLIDTNVDGVDKNFIVLELKSDGNFKAILSERYMTSIGATGDGNGEVNGNWSVFGGKLNLKALNYENGVLTDRLLTFTMVTSVSYGGNTMTSRIEVKFNKVNNGGNNQETETVLPEIPVANSSVQVDEEAWKSALSETWETKNITCAVKSNRTFNGKEYTSVVFIRLTKDNTLSDIYEIHDGKKIHSELYWSTKKPQASLASVNSSKWFELASSDSNMNLNTFDSYLGSHLCMLSAHATGGSDDEYFKNDVYARWNEGGFYYNYALKDMYSGFTYDNGYEYAIVQDKASLKISLKIGENGFVSYVKTESAVEEENVSVRITYEYVFYDCGTTQISEPDGAKKWYDDHWYSPY